MKEAFESQEALDKERAKAALLLQDFRTKQEELNVLNRVRSITFCDPFGILQKEFGAREEESKRLIAELTAKTMTNAQIVKLTEEIEMLQTEIDKGRPDSSEGTGQQNAFY